MLSERLYKNQKSESQDGSCQTGSTCISASILDSEEISEANPVVSGLRSSMVLSEKIDVETGSE
jgi:hypothetical protein